MPESDIVLLNKSQFERLETKRALLKNKLELFEQTHIFLVISTSMVLCILMFQI